MRIRGGVLAGFSLVLFAAGLLVPGSSSAIQIHAHRGGPNVEGKAMFGENSMSAFRHSAEAGFVVEFDLGRTSDGVAVAMHDESLDRTTNCAGDVSESTWAELSSCRIDRIGTGDVRENLDPGDPRLEPVPRLSQIIDLLKETGAAANIEVKNPGGSNLEFPHAVYTELAASGLPSKQVILQNFKSSNLKDAASIYPGVTTSQLFLSLSEELDQLLVNVAAENGSAWISPQWPFPATLMTRAREAGLLVVPWTIDDPVQMVEAAELGVDGVITDDPTMAQRVIGMYPQPGPKPEPVPKPKLTMKLLKGKVRARPGGMISFTARIGNTGGSTSGPLRLNAFAGSGTLRLVQKWPRTVSSLKPGQSRKILIKVRVMRKAKRAGSFRIAVQLAGHRKSPVKRSIKVRVLRSRR